MVKQMISFTDPQLAILKRVAKRLGISVAELVRRIVDAHFAKLAIMLLALGWLAGCSSPTAPTESAMLEARGELALTCDDSTCRFTGTAVNRGTGCAAQVSGTVALRVIGQLEPLAQTSVNVEHTIPPGDFAYSGEVSKKVIVGLLPSQWYTSTSFVWQDVTCRV